MEAIYTLGFVSRLEFNSYCNAANPRIVHARLSAAEAYYTLGNNPHKATNFGSAIGDLCEILLRAI